MNTTGEDIVKHLPMELINWFKDTLIVIVKHGGKVEGYQFTMYPGFEDEESQKTDGSKNVTDVNGTHDSNSTLEGVGKCNQTCNCSHEADHDKNTTVQTLVEPQRNLTLDELLEQLHYLVPNATISRSNYSINITLIEQNFTQPENDTTGLDIDDGEEDEHDSDHDSKTDSSKKSNKNKGYMTVKSYIKTYYNYYYYSGYSYSYYYKPKSVYYYTSNYGYNSYTYDPYDVYSYSYYDYYNSPDSYSYSYSSYYYYEPKYSYSYYNYYGKKYKKSKTSKWIKKANAKVERFFDKVKDFMG